MKKIIALMAALALAGCTTSGGQVNWPQALAKSCSTSKPFVDALTVIYTTGGMSSSNAKRFETAKFTYDQVCDGTMTNFASTAAKAATMYVLLVSIKRSEG